MIIEGKVHADVAAEDFGVQSFHVSQQEDLVIIDKHQAAQLAEVLQKWLAGEEVE